MNLPHCALECAAEISGATNQTLVCSDMRLQMNISSCVQRQCTVKAALIAQNVTATICQWPHRDESSLCRNVAVVLFICATAAVAARVTSRLPGFNGPLWTDDYLMVLIWIMLTPFTSLLFVISYNGLGRDIWTLQPEIITLNLKYTSILLYFYLTLVWLTKISILFLYLRLFPDTRFRNVVKTAIVLCCMAGISFLVGSVMRCTPIEFTWTFWDGEHTGKCTDILYSAQGWPHLAVNMTADLIILVLPLPTLWKLNLALEKKLSVMSMFSVGLFVTAINIYRATTFPALLASHNPTWDYTRVGLWSSIEVYTGVICACMPGIRAFVTQVFPARKWIRVKQSDSVVDGSYSHGTIGSGGSGKPQIRGTFEAELTHTTISISHELVDGTGPGKCE